MFSLIKLYHYVFKLYFKNIVDILFTKNMLVSLCFYSKFIYDLER